MDAATEIVIWAAIALAAGVAAWIMAGRKNRPASPWAAWCFVLPPLLLVLLLLPRHEGPPPPRRRSTTTSTTATTSGPSRLNRIVAARPFDLGAT